MGKYPNNLYKYFNQYTDEEIKTFGLYSGVSNLTVDLLAEKLLEWSINATSRVVDDTLDLIGDVKNSIDNWKDFIFSNSWLDSDGMVKYNSDVYIRLQSVYNEDFYTSGGIDGFVKAKGFSGNNVYGVPLWFYNKTCNIPMSDECWDSVYVGGYYRNGYKIGFLGIKYSDTYSVSGGLSALTEAMKNMNIYITIDYSGLGVWTGTGDTFCPADVPIFSDQYACCAAFFGGEIVPPGPNDRGYETITTINPITPTALVSNNYNTANQTINLYYASGGSDINEILDEIIESYEPEELGDSSDYVDYQNGLILGLLVKGFEDAPTYIDVFGRAGTVAINIDEYPYTKILNGKTKIIANTYFNAVLYNKPQVTITWEVK